MRLLLLLSGDVETNPGPFPSLPSLPSFDRKEDPVILRLEDQEDKIRKVSCLDIFSCNSVTESTYLDTRYHMSSFRDSYLCLSILILSSELKELVEKQTQVIVNMQGKLEECGKNLDSTTSDLEKTKLENKRMREELNNQNAKFQDMFGILQQEDKDIVATFLKQKVDIDNHRESLKKFMELLCEETEKNKNSINNITNFSQNTSVKVDELTEKVALRQVKFLSSLG